MYILRMSDKDLSLHNIKSRLATLSKGSLVKEEGIGSDGHP
jgi:hypothetical protein